MKMNKFTVFYNDKTQFSGDPINKDWIKVDDTKQITKLQYSLGNKCIVMEGFKQYNHLIEYVALGVKRIQKILLMGRKSNVTIIIIFDLQNSRIYKLNKAHGEEYGKQILAGWKNGILDNPKAYFKEIKNV
jgi:hypothetical protein